MTVETTARRAQYDTNGTTGPFTVPFYFLEDSHLQVIHTDAGGVETTLTLTTDFTVTGAGVESGGTVTTVASYAAGGHITILRDVPALQETDYTETDAFPAASHERALDLLTMSVQQQAEVIARALVFPPTDEDVPSLPAAVDRANTLLAFDAVGNPVTTIPDPQDATAVALALAALTSDLASTSSATKGAGMVGHDDDLSYAADTVGAALAARPKSDTLASPADGKGAELIGHSLLVDYDDATAGLQITRASRQRPAGWGVYTEELDGSLEAAADLASLGVSYVIYFFHGNTNATRIANALIDLANFDALGIGVILLPRQTVTAADWTAVATEFVGAPNLIGWYVLDEPSAHSYTITQQDGILTAARALLNIPCYTADNGDSWPALTLSPNYDFIFFNPYFQVLNAGAPLTSQSGAVRWYANVHGMGLYRPDRLIAVYETYLSADDPSVNTAAFLRAMRIKADMWGPGALFVYSAAKTVPTMKTIANDAQISGVARALLSTPPSSRKVLSFSVPTVDTTAGFTTSKKRAMLSAMVDARSTATLEYAPARLTTRSGVFMTGSQYLVLDFGRVVRSVRLTGRFFDHTNSAGTESKFDVQIPEAVDGSTGSTLEQISVTTGSSGLATWAAGVYADINSRYLVLRPSGSTWSTLSGFDCLAVNAYA